MGSKTDEIKVGKVKRKTFGLPLDVVTQATAILGRRGSGKTNTGGRVVEGVIAAGQQAVVMDPLDVWWGLKSNKSGKRAGLDVLLVGDARKPHTDLPLEEGDGEAIADFLVDERLPCILSTRHLSKSARRRFSAAFLERFYHRKGDPGCDTPCLLVIDEASLVVPQSMREPEQARCVGAVEACVRQGRASGIGVVLIDQRPASVNKDVLTQVELMVTHQLTSPQDRKALQEWVRANDIDGRESEFMDSLASLATGEAWFWSPAWLRCFERVQVSMRETFDSSATPKAGETRVQAGKVSSFDLESVKGKLGASIERARSLDPKVLNKRILELEKERDAARAETGGVDAAEVERRVAGAVSSALAARDTAWREQVMEWGRARLDEIAEAVASARDGIGLAGAGILNEVLMQPVMPEDTGSAAADRARPVAGAAAQGKRQGAVGALTSAPREPVEGVTRAQQKVLDGLAWLAAIGVDRPSRMSLALTLGAKHNGGSFNNKLGALRTAGLLDYPTPGEVALTDRGRKAARAVDPPGTLKELHQTWLGSKTLARAQATMLEVVMSAYPQAMTRDALAERLGATANGGSFNNKLVRLRSLGMIDYPAPGEVIATELLYPAGLVAGGVR